VAVMVLEGCVGPYVLLGLGGLDDLRVWVDGLCSSSNLWSMSLSIIFF